MKLRCRRCRGASVIEIRRHNGAFCRARAQIVGGRLAGPEDVDVARELSEEVLPAEIYDGVEV